MKRALAAALVFTAAVARAEEPKDLGHFAWLPAFLDTHSAVEIAATEGQSREAISTNCSDKLVYDAFVIEYQRMTYEPEAADTLKRHQRIFYTVHIGTIDPESIKVQAAGESAPGIPFWMVSFDARPEPGFFPYLNMLEHYGETRTPQVFSSRGKIRTIILGYLVDEKRANELAEKFRASLKTALDASPELTRPAQSAA
jgi:hypothetical protein